MTFSVCGTETVSLSNSSFEINQWNLYRYDGISNVITITASTFDVFVSSRASCPIYSTKVYTRDDSLVNHEYLGSTCSLSSSGNFEISTAERIFNETLFVGSMTRFSSSIAYFPVYIRVVDCAQEYMTLLKPTLVENLVFQAKSVREYSLDLSSRFQSEHDRCPITTIQIVKVAHSITGQPLANYTSIMALGTSADPSSDDYFGILTITDITKKL